jgi:hypothetical protein
MTYINSTNITTNDLTINVANNAATATAANGGGIGVGPAGSEYRSLTYNSASNIWVASNGLSVQGTVQAQANILGANIVTGGSVTATGNIQGNVFIGNGAGLTSLTGANVTGTVANATYAVSAGSAVGTAATVTTAAQPNITSVGALTAVTVTGNTQSGNLLTAGQVSATGNIQGNVFIGNGAGLTNINAGNIIGAYGNANVAAYLPTYTGNLTAGNVSVSGNIQGNIIIGDGSGLASLTGANVTGTVANATYAVSAGSAVGTAATVTTNAQPNITSVGTLSSLTVTGNVVGGNIVTSGSGGDISGSGNITGGNLLTGGSLSVGGTITVASTAGNVISTAGNISAGYIYGNGALLTGVITSVANINNGTSNITAYNSGNIAVSVSGVGNTVVFTPNATNITGNVSVVGNLSTGNSYLFGNGAYLTGISAAISVTKIENGTSNVWVNTPNGDVTVATNGVANVGVFGTGYLELLGAFSNPKTINTPVTVGTAQNGMLVGPISLGASGQIIVPDGSTVYIISGA